MQQYIDLFWIQMLDLSCHKGVEVPVNFVIHNVLQGSVRITHEQKLQYDHYLSLMINVACSASRLMDKQLEQLSKAKSSAS